MSVRMKRGLLGAAIVLTVIAGALLVTAVVVHEPRPSGVEGPEADALASRIEEAVDLDAWARTGAVRWTFAGRNRHLWDRQRELAQVHWGETVVLLRLSDRTGRVYDGGHEVRGEDAREALEGAYSKWVNDSFWLNPITQFRGDGVSRSTVPLDEGGPGLLIAYSAGGLTPGDAYLWVPGEDGLPTAWRMWVSIIPVGGLEASWTDWQTLSTGVRISTRHAGPLGITVELTDVDGAETLDALVEGPDPFAPLF